MLWLIYGFFCCTAILKSWRASSSFWWPYFGSPGIRDSSPAGRHCLRSTWTSRVNPYSVKKWFYFILFYFILFYFILFTSKVALDKSVSYKFKLFIYLFIFIMYIESIYFILLFYFILILQSKQISPAKLHWIKLSAERSNYFISFVRFQVGWEVHEPLVSAQSKIRIILFYFSTWTWTSCVNPYSVNKIDFHF